MMKSHMLLWSSIALLLFSAIASAQTSVPADRKDWVLVGNITTSVDPYDLLYWKILQLNNSTDRYASIIQVSIQGDANYFNEQGTFEIRVDKYENTLDRFDGVEIRCVSGNPSTGTFYVFKNAIWVRSTYKWGTIHMRTIGDFANASPKAATFLSTITAPTGAVVVAQYFGVKCDFDNNVIYKLPYTDAFGNERIGGNYTVPSGEETPKLAVGGTLTAKRVKVTQTGWADFVFDPHYELPSLGFVEAYIKAHRHLPEIPSAQEVQEQGQDLGEMNKQLLQKIEELTLYIIEMKKESQQQGKEIKELKEKLKEQ